MMTPPLPQVEAANASAGEISLAAHAAPERVLASASATEEHFRLIVDSIPGLIFTYDARGQLEFVNRQLLDFFGRPLEILHATDVAAIVHPEDFERAEEIKHKSITAGIAHSYELRLRRSDGLYRWFQLRCAPFAGPHGSIIRWYGCLSDIDALKEAENRSREESRSLSLLIDTIPALVFTKQASGPLEWVNQNILDYFNLSLGELQRWQMTDVIHPEDLPHTIQRVREGGAAGLPYELEHRMRRSDGVYRWFHYRTAPLRDEKGSIIRWYGLVTDIDDLKRAQEQARQNEHQLRLILDNIPGSVFTMTSDGEMEQVNQHVLNYFGKSFDELRDWTSVTHPDDVDSVRAVLEHGLATGTAWESTSRALRADGVYRWFQTHGRPLCDAEGRVMRWYCVNDDIDDFKRAQEDARLSERHLRLILDNIPGYVFTLTPTGEIEQLNRQIMEFFGLPFEELLDWSRVTHPDDLEQARTRLQHAITTETSWHNEVRALRADGVYRWFQTRGLPLRDTNGRILRWYCLLVDIDDLRRAEETSRSIQARLSKASQLAAVSELAASIAHEVNQPLAAVIANGHACHRWLAADPPNVERALLSAQRTIRDGNSAAEVVARIRSLFRHAPPSKQLLSLNDVIEEVARIIADDLLSKGVFLRLRLQADLPLAPVDRVQLQQVIANLARNGIEAMDAIEGRTKELTISSSMVEGEIIVEVKDVGLGLNDDASSFDPFVTTKPNGMGMGLSICRTILDAHAGRLWSVPNAPQGATFGFAVPALIEPPRV
jgi:PAS domain S-box-containing protein